MDALWIADYLEIEAKDKSLCRCLSQGAEPYHAPNCPLRLMREAAELLRQTMQEVA